MQMIMHTRINVSTWRKKIFNCREIRETTSLEVVQKLTFSVIDAIENYAALYVARAPFPG